MKDSSKKIAKGSNQKLGGGGIHHVALRARDFDASVKFYTEVLGFSPVMRWGEGNGRAVMLDTGNGNCLEVFAGGPEGSRHEGTLLHLALRTTRIDKVMARVRASGAEITVEPKDVEIPSQPRTPARLAFFKGPDGEILELFQLR